MKIDAELNWAKNSARTKQELLDARIKSIDSELLDVIEEVLDQRFPNWDVKDVGLVSSGQKAQTYVHFRGQQKTFTAAKNAYVWLIEEMLSACPNLTFGNVVLVQMFINGAHGARYLALTPEELSKDHNRTKKDILWHELPNKWILNLRLSNKQKFDRLTIFAAACNLKYDEDWSWRIEGEEESDLSDFDEMMLELKS
jgi:hypothetical protein